MVTFTPSMPIAGAQGVPRLARVGRASEGGSLHLTFADDGVSFDVPAESVERMVLRVRDDLTSDKHVKTSAAQQLGLYVNRPMGEGEFGELVRKRRPFAVDTTAEAAHATNLTFMGSTLNYHA